jgi:hypothetical protein
MGTWKLQHKLRFHDFSAEGIKREERTYSYSSITISVITEISQEGPRQFLEMSDKPSHPRQLYCGRAARITKISLSLSRMGRCVCQLLSGLKVKICPEVTEPQKCQPQYKEQRSLELRRRRRTSDNDHPHISRQLCFLFVYRTFKNINSKYLKTKRLRKYLSQVRSENMCVLIAHSKELRDLLHC